jgi:hypothetical protein
MSWMTVNVVTTRNGLAFVWAWPGAPEQRAAAASIAAPATSLRAALLPAYRIQFARMATFSDQ